MRRKRRTADQRRRNTIWSRKRRERLRGEGLCDRCGKVPPTDGSYQCVPCREKSRAAARASMRSRLSRRRCYECLKPLSEDDGVRCPRCVVRHRERMVRTRDRAREAGLCISCSRRPVDEPGFSSCSTCRRERRERLRLRRRQLHEDGLCITCREPTDRPDRLQCFVCGMKESRRVTDHRAGPRPSDDLLPLEQALLERLRRGG